jgi:hypothetical protein
MQRPTVEKCCVCGAVRSLAFTHIVLGKYSCEYFFCENCGLLQTPNPYWLAEAYDVAIGKLDTGVLARNIKDSKILSLLLPYLSPREGKYLDAAGGYGILTRLMRDLGFDYYWSDKYCSNLFAVGFEGSASTEYDVVSAFEVLEHVTNPFEFLSGVIEQTRCKTIVLSTELYSGQPPAPNDWWYYAFDGGQHISFYQERTLRVLADRLGLNLFTRGSIHLLTNQRLSPLAFSLRADKRVALLFSPITRVLRKSKTMSDHRSLLNR